MESEGPQRINNRGNFRIETMGNAAETTTVKVNDFMNF